MKLNKLFDILQGHQITDEELYVAVGDIPVITARNEIKGYWNKSIITKENLPCITYPTKGNSGESYVQNNIFDANNTAVLLIKPEWKKCIDLEWFSLKLKNVFLQIQTSKEGVSYLNKEIIEDIEIDFPDINIQIKEKEKFFKLIAFKNKLDFIISKINKIKSFPLVNEYGSYQGKQIPVSIIFNFVNSNSGLTEEYTYSILFLEGEKKYNLLTGSMDIKNTKSTKKPVGGGSTGLMLL